MIEVQHLTKRFGPLTVLRDVSLSVPKGSICGFIGPNGAGKTTTMRILATLELPSTGSVRIGDRDVVEHADEVRRLLGYMPDYYGAYPDMVVHEYLEFFARAAKLAPDVRRSRTAEIVEFTELGRLRDRPVEGMSKGEKQRLSLARALLSDPQLLILDEPAAGLDPRARVELRELLKLLSSQGKTVFISSHILSELAEMVDWVVVIDRGRVRFSGDPSSAAQGAPARPFVLQVTSDAGAAQRWLLEQPALRVLESQEGWFLLDLNEAALDADELVVRLVSAGIRFRELYQRDADLEDVFLSVTGRQSDAPPE